MMRRSNLTGFCGHNIPRRVAIPRAEGRMDNRGVALVLTLLLLFLMSVLGLAAVLSSSSDLLINGYYSNYRASFYAADSGLNIARQSMEAYLAGIVPAGSSWNTNWNSCTGSTTQPIPSVAWTNAYSSSTPLTGSGTGGSANSWAESFTINSPSLYIPTGGCTYVPTGSGAPYYTYNINYSLTSVGSATGSEQASVTETGSFIVKISGTTGSTPGNVSFSAFGAFINNFPACDNPLVYGLMSGPAYAKGSWNFGTGGSYTFTDPVNQTDSKFSYFPGGSCVQSANPSYSSGNTHITPNFESGYNLSQTAATLPKNAYSQQWAVLDGQGCGEAGASNPCGAAAGSNTTAAPSAATMNSYNMQNVSQANAASVPYGTGAGPTAATSGVFMPYTCSGSTCTLSSTAGGIYVEGSNSNVTTNLTLTAATSSSFSSTSFPTSSQCTAASCQVVQVSQTNTSGGSPSTTVAAVGSNNCTYNSFSGKYTCKQNYTQTTTTTTGTTTNTTITIDPTTNLTTASTVVTTNGSQTVATAQGSCQTYSSSGCTPPAPNNFPGGTETDTSSNAPATNLTLTGVPTVSQSIESPSTSGCTVASGGNCSGTMVYVNGSSNITGPSSGAAIQNNFSMTVTTNGDMQQTGNLTYATEPVTTSQNQSISGSSPACCNGLSADTLIPSRQNMNQVLGLYVANGQFQLNPSSDGGNLETDASIAAINASGTGMMSTPGNSVGTWTIVGGRVENSINGVNISTGNTYFDRRFTTRTGFAPPWFPQTSIALGDITTVSSASETVTPQRVAWATNAGQ